MPLKTAILCRTNAPLVKCAFDLIRKGRNVKVKLVGRDVAKQLKDVIGEVLEWRKNVPIAEFEVLLNGWIDAIRRKFAEQEDKASLVADAEDMHGCLVAMMVQAEDARGLFKVIDTYFVDSEAIDDDPNTVVLASGHRSKGLEWDRVIVLRPDLMPHPNAETEADLRQENHIEYVVLTRGKEELIVCHDKRPD